MKDNVVPIRQAIVLLRGIMRGGGHEAECVMLARKHSLPGFDSNGKKRYEYTQCSVLQARFELPDGEYTVTTQDGHVIATTRVYGHWIVGHAQWPAA